MAPKKDKPLRLEEKIKKCKDEITANAKDAAWMKRQLARLTSLQKQDDIEPVELIVPCKEVKDTIDFGAVKISRTIRGYLFEAKGGMSTFVDNRMSAVCAMLHTLFELHNKERNEEEEQLYEAFRESVLYIFQAPIFASLGDELLFGIAADMLHRFREYAEPRQEIPHEETEEDIEANIEYEKTAKAIDVLVGTENLSS